MNEILYYNGYQARVEIDFDGSRLTGYFQGSEGERAFHADTVDELITAFRKAVDDYVAECATLGKQSEPFDPPWRDLDDDETKALRGFDDRDIAPFIELLRSEADRPHPVLQRTLRKLLEGNGEYKDLILKLANAAIHHKKTGGYKLAQFSKQVRIARLMLVYGASKHGGCGAQD